MFLRRQHLTVYNPTSSKCFSDNTISQPMIWQARNVRMWTFRSVGDLKGPYWYRGEQFPGWALSQSWFSTKNELGEAEQEWILQKIGAAYRHVPSNFFSSYLVQNILQELNYVNKCHSIATSHRKGEDSPQFKGKSMPILLSEDKWLQSTAETPWAGSTTHGRPQDPGSNHSTKTNTKEYIYRIIPSL